MAEISLIWKRWKLHSTNDALGPFILKTNINILSKKEFGLLDIAQAREELSNGNAYLVKNFFSLQKVMEYRNFFKEFSDKHVAKFYPLTDDCPDYHWYNDEYEESYIKCRSHVFRFHLWQKQNASILNDFMEFFEFKRQIANAPNLDHINNIPSDGYVARLDINHYPSGGGYLTEHLDPYDHYNPVQTIIKGSEKGVDFQTGGVYLRNLSTGEKISVEEDFGIGDMLAFRQDLIPHGVDSIDEREELDWSLDRGRFIYIPVFVRSEYIKNDDNKSVVFKFQESMTN